MPKSYSQFAQDAIRALESIPRSGPECDCEQAHMDADAILLEFLENIDFAGVADAWRRAAEEIGFWYA